MSYGKWKTYASKFLPQLLCGTHGLRHLRRPDHRRVDRRRYFGALREGLNLVAQRIENQPSGFKHAADVGDMELVAIHSELLDDGDGGDRQLLRGIFQNPSRYLVSFFRRPDGDLRKLRDLA